MYKAKLVSYENMVFMHKAGKFHMKHDSYSRLRTLPLFISGLDMIKDYKVQA